MSAAVRSRIAP